MTNFDFKTLCQRYLDYRIACAHSASSARSFINFQRAYGKESHRTTGIDQGFVKDWFKLRTTEKASSYYNRVMIVQRFLEYCHQHGLLHFPLPTIERDLNKGKPPIHHHISTVEARNLFKAADEHVVDKMEQHIIGKASIQVILRMLYSTGMRIPEVQSLKRQDVNFDNGCINVHGTKGYKGHTLILHDSMLDLIKSYDNAMERIVPNREYLISTISNRRYSYSWIKKYFGKLWYKYNVEHAVLYDFRHTYAIANINKWENEPEINDKLIALGSTMGHSSISSTLYYYSLIPQLHDDIEKLMRDKYNLIIKKINYEKGKQ